VRDPATPNEPVLRAIDHVQLAIPVGGEALARWFYTGVLGLVEVPKPAALAVRGGCWFERGDVRVHVGVEAGFRPARKAHPAFVVDGLDALVERHTLAVTWSDEIPGTHRCHIDDPFGNRIELIDG
jgi:catechol 2,3-dioxygenase-like lactoylglutathione lyase family enzyme